MVSLNQTQITGNITAVPELKTIGEGEDNVVVEGTMIHNWASGEASQQERKAVLGFKIYGKHARRFAETVTPKNNILLTGHIETDSWMNGDQHRSRTYLYVRGFQYNSARVAEAEPKSSTKAKSAKAKRPKTDAATESA